MTELLPCPFCGSSDVEGDEFNMYWVGVRCNKCYATGPIVKDPSFDFTDKECTDGLAKTWNTRVDKRLGK